MPREPKCRQWIVRVQATVTKDVYCEDCTEKQATRDPFNYATEIQELEQIDWKVVDVMHND